MSISHVRRASIWCVRVCQSASRIHVKTRPLTYECVGSHTWMRWIRRVTYINESYLQSINMMCSCVSKCITYPRMNKSCYIWINQIESCHTYEWIMTYTIHSCHIPESPSHAYPLTWECYIGLFWCNVGLLYVCKLKALFLMHVYLGLFYLCMCKEGSFTYACVLKALLLMHVYRGLFYLCMCIEGSFTYACMPS